jgi:hypothetical protein
VTFGDAAYGRVAGHLRDQVQVHGHQGGPGSDAGAGKGRFAPRMAGADHNDVVPLVH